MDYTIKPYKGFGIIKFGMSSEQITNILGEHPRKFKKHISSKYETDQFSEFFVYYKNPGVCEAIEFFAPAKVFYSGVQILNIEYYKVKGFFSSIDSCLEFDDSGFISHKKGIAIYVPNAVDYPEDKVESVLIFDRGYYERWRNNKSILIPE